MQMPTQTSSREQTNQINMHVMFLMTHIIPFFDVKMLNVQAEWGK